MFSLRHLVGVRLPPELSPLSAEPCYAVPFIQSFSAQVVLTEPFIAGVPAPSTSSQKKRCAGGGCCCLLLFVFLPCWFLIPRSTYVRAYGPAFFTDDFGTYTQSAKFYNPNYYETTFSNLEEIDLTWSTFYYYGELGTASYPGSFTVSSGSNKIVPFEVIVVPGAIPLLLDVCLQSSFVDIRWSGYAKATYWIGGMYNTRISFVSRWYC